MAMHDIFINFDKKDQGQLDGLKMDQDVTVTIKGRVKGMSKSDFGGNVELEVDSFNLGDLSGDELKQGFRKL